MKLINLVPYLKSFDSLEELYKLNNLDIKSEAIIIYMEETLAIESEIVFFEIEETKDNLTYKKNGINYIQLFPVNYAMEIIEDLLGFGYDELEIAQRLLEYRIKDG